MVWRLQNLQSDGINLIAILAIVAFNFFFFSWCPWVRNVLSLLSTFRVPMYTEICTPPKIFLKSSPAKWFLAWIIIISRKARTIERIFVKSQISCRYPFSVNFPLYLQITFWYQHRENCKMVHSLFRRLMIITSRLLWSNLIVVLIVLSHQI